MKTDSERELAKFEFLEKTWYEHRPFWIALLGVWIIMELLSYL